MKPDESAQVALLMGDRNTEWDFSRIKDMECETVSKNYLVNATPVDFKLLEEGEATAVAGAYHMNNGKLERLRFSSKRFVAQLGGDNKVVIEFKDEKDGGSQ